MDAALPPLVEPAADLRPDLSRFVRQTVLPGFGVEAQRRLAAARVLVVGLGGLGSPVVQYLAGAGVGTIGLLDDDVVQASNLHRQVIHSTGSIGLSKVSSASAAVHAIDPAVEAIAIERRLDPSNAHELLAGFDVIVDASDTAATKYAVSDAAERLGVPVVWGSVLRLDGQVSVFWANAPGGRGLTLRDLHPVPADEETCEIAGVLGPVCGWAGSLMATETVKLITGLGRVLLGRVAVIDGLDGTQREIAVRRGRVDALAPRDATAPVSATPTPDPAAPGPAPTIAPDELRVLLEGDPAPQLLDVRGLAELDPPPLPGSLRIPHETILDGTARLDLDPAAPLVVYCAIGKRSARVVEHLAAHGFTSAVSLAGGLAAYPR